MANVKLRYVVVLFFGIIVYTYFSILVINHIKKENEVKNSEQERLKLYNQILDGASIKPSQLTIDYTTQGLIGSPLIFGGAQYPWHQDLVWNYLSEMGATAIRTDFYLEYMVPKNISLDDYINNKNNVRDPATWQIEFINERKKAFSSAKARGMKTIGIISYAPPWLTYSNTQYGVPKNWDVYEDIVKKAYSFHRDNIDYIEIWNEPDNFFLDVTGSGLSKQEAYADIFYHAAKAIREIDKIKNDGRSPLIGGPATASSTDISYLEAVLQNHEAGKYINFVSFHDYLISEPSDTSYRDILKKYNLEHLPIYITEWNYDSKEKEDNPNKTSNEAILFTGNKFINFLKMGITGANYYSFLQVQDFTKNKDADAEYLGIYRLNNNNVKLLPQSRTWRILSKDMLLGKGKSEIYLTKVEDNEINTIGFTNVDKNQGVIVTNPSSLSKTIDIRFTGLSIKEYARIEVYYASATNEALIPEYEGTLKIKDRSTRFIFNIPAEAIMAIKLKQDPDINWLNPFN